MLLPNANNAEVPDRKLAGYLLDHDHPQNKGKAAFYEIVGFTKNNADELRVALLDHAKTNEVVKWTPTEHGVRFVVEGQMFCPNGKRYPIRSVWFIDNDQVIPKLVTAYPS